MTILIKLGGSLITDKRQPRSFRQNVVRHIAAQVRHIRAVQPELRLVIGHGSGAFGHVEAARYKTMAGVHSAADWLGFAKVGQAAAELSQYVLAEFVAADLPAVRFPPSTLLRVRQGKIQAMDTDLIAKALEHGLIPLVHGDVAFDEQMGGTIASTELIFGWLAGRLDVKRILLLGEVDGVLDSGNEVIREIRPSTLDDIKAALGGAGGVDVTGGMAQKVAEMAALVERCPDLEIVIANGRRRSGLIELICGQDEIGTRIRSDNA